MYTYDSYDMKLPAAMATGGPTDNSHQIGFPVSAGSKLSGGCYWSGAALRQHKQLSEPALA
jgi:hypothetical protein